MAPVATAPKVKFQPLADRLVVRPLEQEEKTASGIILPDTAKEKPQEGEVVAVGPGRMTNSGIRVTMEVRVADRVLYSKFAGTECKVANIEYLLLRESDVLAKIAN